MSSGGGSGKRTPAGGGGSAILRSYQTRPRRARRSHAVALGSLGSLGRGRQNPIPPRGSGFQKSTTVLRYGPFSFTPSNTLAWRVGPDVSVRPWANQARTSPPRDNVGATALAPLLSEPSVRECRPNHGASHATHLTNLV